MNDFVKRHWNGIGGKRLYEPAEPIEIECDLNSGSAPFRCDCRFKLGLVSLGGIVYNEYASDHCVKMSYLCHRFRINGKVYDLRQYRSNEEAFDPFIAIVEENITPQEVIVDDEKFDEYVKMTLKVFNIIMEDDVVPIDVEDILL